MDEDYTNDRAEYIEVRIDRVEDRVTSLEQQIITRSFDPQWGMEKALSRIANLERTVYNCTPDALKEPVTQKDVDRWRAIETAAGLILGWIDSYCDSMHRDGPLTIALRKALKK